MPVTQEFIESLMKQNQMLLEQDSTLIEQADSLNKTIDELNATIKELREQLNKNSGNYMPQFPLDITNNCLWQDNPLFCVFNNTRADESC